MFDRRQKNQLDLAWREETRGETPKPIPAGTESSAAKHESENRAITEALMEEVCKRENCKRA